MKKKKPIKPYLFLFLYLDMIDWLIDWLMFYLFFYAAAAAAVADGLCWEYDRSSIAGSLFLLFFFLYLSYKYGVDIFVILNIVIGVIDETKKKMFYLFFCDTAAAVAGLC